VARAKRTDRADARRRYRQTYEGAQDTVAAEDANEAVDPDQAPRRAAPTAGRPMGFTAAMRTAWHPPDIRADIAALPWLLRTRGFLVPLALVLVGIAAVIAAPTNTVAGMFFQLMVLPPAMAPIFVVGFFAKRASYLLGLIIAVVDLIGYTVFVYSVLPTISTDPISAAHQQELVLSALAVGPPSGLVFASGAAWYRRFLSYSSAQRARARTSGPQRGKAGRPARG